MWRRFLERTSLAFRRPDLLWRRIRGRDAADIKLDEIGPYIGPRPVIVEAGAWNGGDTARFAERWPDSEIHAFEPVPSSFAIEVSRKELYEGSGLYPEVVAWLQSQGFEVAIDRVFVGFGNMPFVNGGSRLAGHPA